MALGEELLERELRRRKLSPNLARSKEILEAAKAFKLKTHDDIFIAIGYGKLSAHQLVDRLLPEPERVKKTQAVKEPKEVLKEEGIRIDGVDNILFHRSKCCSPLPGDRIIGFVTRGKGISIHTVDCPNLDSLVVDGDRLVDVEWVRKGDAIYPAKISISTIDQPGILASLSATISADNINISHVDASATQDKQAHFNFVIEVRDKPQLDGILKKLSQLKGVLEVKRVKSI